MVRDIKGYARDGEKNFVKNLCAILLLVVTLIMGKICNLEMWVKLTWLRLLLILQQVSNTFLGLSKNSFKCYFFCFYKAWWNSRLAAWASAYKNKLSLFLLQ